MCSEAGMARLGKLKRHDGSEANAMAAKTSVKASLLSLHDKQYPGFYTEGGSPGISPPPSLSFPPQKS